MTVEVYLMFNLIGKLLNFVNDTRKPEQLTMLTWTHLSTGGMLEIYTVGDKNAQFKVLHKCRDTVRVKYIHRLIKDRRPMEELNTGIHDDALSKFAKVRVQFYK